MRLHRTDLAAEGGEGGGRVAAHSHEQASLCRLPVSEPKR
jgi:hypothetical protein